MYNRDLIDKMLSGNVYAMAKIISQVESQSDYMGQIMQDVFPHCKGANIIGITGPPGAGKSSMVYHLAKNLSQRNHKAAVLAIDPNSPLTGGALLGDRIRMDDLQDVYIRSIGNRCSMGGIATSAYLIIKILEACKYDYIFIETVGAGQSEVKIKDLADITMLVLAPGLGDDIQANKAGIMEIGDVLVVNKADKPEAERLKTQLKDMLHTSQRQQDNIAVFSTDCINKIGFGELIEHLINMLAETKDSKKEIEKLKTQYIEMISKKIEMLLNDRFSNSHMDSEMIKVLQGDLDILKLMDKDIQNILK